MCQVEVLSSETPVYRVLYIQPSRCDGCVDLFIDVIIQVNREREKETKRTTRLGFMGGMPEMELPFMR